MEVNFSEVIKELANKGYFMSSSDRDYISEEIEDLNCGELDLEDNCYFKEIYWDSLCKAAENDQDFMKKLHEVYSDYEFDDISDLDSDEYYDIEKMICEYFDFCNLELHDNFYVSDYDAWDVCVDNNFIDPEKDPYIDNEVIVNYIIENYSDNLVNINEINKEEVA